MLTIMSIDAVLDEVSQYDCGLVEVTGGEPLPQPGGDDLTDGLLALGKMLADALRARWQVQLHKYIWGAEARGV
jgi:hypothetical protein